MKSNIKSISVIIATYNSEKTLPKTLEAIRYQTYQQDKIEILVVDGMSKDKTRKIAEAYNCIIIDNPKVEQGNAKILGMQHATGDFILFVDSDEVLENKEALEKSINALIKESDTYVALCSGYKKPDDYPLLSGYISDFGDPFSFYMYNFPKDYRFYEQVIKKYYAIIKENDDYMVFDCDIERHFPLIEGGCGGIIIDAKYFSENVPNCKFSIAELYHSFYKMIKNGHHKTIFVKNNPLVHYSSDKLVNYLRKIKWRVCNNVHFSEKGAEVFDGRQSFQSKNKNKKYFFVPYSLSVIVPFIHSIPYAISRKNSVYLLHMPLCIYTTIQIVFQYALKLMNITPSFVAYGSKNKIDK